MTRYEYDKIDLSSAPVKTGDITLLNRAGAQGWELVAVTVNYQAARRSSSSGVCPCARLQSLAAEVLSRNADESLLERGIAA